MTARLVCVGDIVVDVTVSLDALPERGGDVIAESGELLAGGTGFNVLAAARRLGVDAVYGGMHGTGPFGDIARAALERENIAVLLEADATTDTGWDVAITDAGSERTFITVVGAEATLTSERIARVVARPGDAVYVSGYGLLGDPNASAIVDWLGTLPGEVIVVTDPGPLVGDIARDTIDSVLERTTWFSCNHAEATAVTGETDPAVAALSLVSASRGAVLRRGADGCLVAPPGAGSMSQIATVPGFAVNAVDSNGAGDAHVGAFIASLLDGFNPVAAARRANAAAAIAVTRRGPATGPTSAELESFLASRPVK